MHCLNLTLKGNSFNAANSSWEMYAILSNWRQKCMQICWMVWTSFFYGVCHNPKLNQKFMNWPCYGYYGRAMVIYSNSSLSTGEIITTWSYDFGKILPFQLQIGYDQQVYITDTPLKEKPIGYFFVAAWLWQISIAQVMEVLQS